MSDIDYRKAYERQKKARERAEDILENRSRELYEVNSSLEKAIQKLDSQKDRMVQQEKLASIGLLASGIAHEINNPIAFIKSNLETLADYIKLLNELFVPFKEVGAAIDENPDQLDYREALMRLLVLARENDLDFVIRDSLDSISDCVEGTRRVEDIIRNLREFTVGDQETRELIDLNVVIDDAIGLANQELKHKVRISRQFEELPEIYACRGQLKQVFLNLLVNAVQAMDGKGELSFSTYRDDDGVVAEVTDSGPGIEPENLSRLFDPFFTTKQVGSGTGLGLYICHGIVTKHSGEITVENVPAGGACFKIRLPESMRDIRR